MGDAETPSNTAEVALNVERYVLPKFKVAVDFTSKDNKPKRDYRPGDHVTGTVRANYFFGKPVDGSEVSVKASSMDVSLVEAGEVSGKTDKDGAYHFDLTLPDYFAGRPLSQGAARVLVEATVKDSASHSETRGEPITVSQNPLLITAVPEGGKLIPNLENEVFLLTSYPDGTPAKTDISVHISGIGEQHLSTDDGGVAVVKIKAGADEMSLQIDADDHRGATASAGIPLPSLDSMGEDQVLLRTERAVYRAGEPIDLKVFSTLRRGTAFVDVLKDGQTVLTRDLDIENGQAELSLTATPEMAGTLDFNAYIFGHDARPIGDHRLIFVQPADELKIETTADAQAYKPGEDARIRFRVTNSRGNGVSAAIGLQIVDEAVFALAEKQPGFAKVFFYLEQEAMKPRYEIHSLSMNEVVEPLQQLKDQHSQVEQRDLAARALFAATEIVNPNRFQTQFGDTLPQEKYAEYISRYQAAFVAQISKITAKLTRAYAQNPDGGDLPKIYSRVMNEQSSKPRDAWGTEYRLEPTGWSRGNTRYYRMVSAGADRQFDTADDLKVYVEIGSDNLSNAFGVAGIDLRVEHDRSSVGQFGIVTGKVADVSGAVIPGAAIELRSVSSGRTRSVTSDGSGEFSIGAVSGGPYHVEISAPGFVTAALDFSVKPRDRAHLSATLNVGAVSTSVEVASDAQVLGEDGAPRATARAAMGMGFAGGVMGGVLGGVGNANQTVNVTAMGGPILQTENAELGSAINGRAVDPLLQKGRNLQHTRRSRFVRQPGRVRDARAACALLLPGGALY